MVSSNAMFTCTTWIYCESSLFLRIFRHEVSKGEGNKWCSLPLHRKKQVRERYKQGQISWVCPCSWNVYGTGIEGVESVIDEGKVRLLQFLIQISERWATSSFHCFFVLEVYSRRNVQGTRSVRASSLEAIFIFVCPLPLYHSRN